MANQIPNQLSLFFNRLSMRQKVMLGTAAAISIGMLILLVSVVNRPTYSILFSNLGPEDGSKIITKLKEKSVPFQIEDNGKTILVPKPQLYELRLSLAGEGLPHSSTIGYEIFDRTNLGVSDFVQKVNYRRAIEGELARTILQIEEVEAARVHIVQPEKALFKEDEKTTTASVILKLKSGKPLTKETIYGIAHLIASSVEGLDASDVTIVDSRGVMLSENKKQTSLSALSSTQYELQQKVESYLGQKAQQMLEGVVGAGNALVQVNAELDFRQVERNLEKYDPENATIRSEQSTEEETPMSDTAMPSTRRTTTTNYEINKSVEHIVEGMGTVKRLSVAVLVNGTVKSIEKEGVQSTQYEPRKDIEIVQFTDVVKRAVGYDAQRNDEISVVNLPFGNVVPPDDMVYKETPFSDWYGIAEKVFLVAAMLVSVLILRRMLNRMKVRVSNLPGGIMLPDEETALLNAKGGQRQLMNGTIEQIAAKKERLQLASREVEISEEALLREEKRKRIAQYITEKPDEASRLLKVWLAEA